MNKPPAVHDLKFLDPNPPAFPDGEVREIADRLFGLEGEFKPLVSERDQNFRVQTANGGRYVFKIANADEDPDVVDLQAQALRHVERVDPHMPVPRVVRTRAGEARAWVEGSNGTRHIVRALTYLPGTNLGMVPLAPALLRNLGGAIARLDRALRGFHHPAARHELLWDLQKIPQLRPHTSHIADAERRVLVESVLDEFAKEVLPRLARLRAQVIHHDANGDNVVVDPAAPEKITGIIDFGDMIHSPLAADLAVTAGDLLTADDLIETMCELVAGYDAVLPLEEEEIDVLYDLTLARCALTAVIIGWRNSAPGGSGYLESYGPRAHAKIEALLSLGRARVRARLRDACRFPPHCPKPGEPDIRDDVDELVARRRHFLGATLELSYTRPVHVVRGEGPWLFGADGSRYLDAYNNVPQVGHAHPHVARAIARQAAALNTNTRYLYRIILDYAERLTATMPEGLNACLFVNSGSEANDAAFRMAKLMTGNEGALVMDNAYHGITETIAALSPYGLGQQPLQAHVKALIAPDPYRGPYKSGEPDLAARYASDADRAIADLAEAGNKPAAFMIDSGFTSNGIPDVPEGYLARVAGKVRAAGGLLIADEVQFGFARSGTHFWGFQAHGVVPDFVTLGRRGNRILQHLRRQPGRLRGRHGGARRYRARGIDGECAHHRRLSARSHWRAHAASRLDRRCPRWGTSCWCRACSGPSHPGAGSGRNPAGSKPYARQFRSGRKRGSARQRAQDSPAARLPP
jgi:Ser/Thr protein kinase RdoA (MazF antagonist)